MGMFAPAMLEMSDLTIFVGTFGHFGQTRAHTLMQYWVLVCGITGNVSSTFFNINKQEGEEMSWCVTDTSELSDNLPTPQQKALTRLVRSCCFYSFLPLSPTATSLFQPFLPGLTLT